ncbi:MAG: ATP-binding protein, partial [Nitrospinota bacterium]|nr:ATP-binding protein [Nitrospinota bacterium]
FSIRPTQVGFVLAPIINGQTLSDDQYNTLNPEVREEIEKKRAAFNQKLGDFLKKMKGLEKEIRERARALQREVGIQVIGVLMQVLREDYAESPEILSYFDQVQESILSRLDEFRKGVQETPGEGAVKAEGGEGGEGGGAAPAGHEMQITPPGRDPFAPYRVNVFVDNGDLEHPPVIFENNPTFQNLFGFIEKKASFGTYITDVSMIRAGSVSRANGGYLVFHALDALTNPGVWNALKRTLRTGQVQIEELGELMGWATMGGMKPMPIPTDLKVVMVGNPYVYHVLHQVDEDFRKLFKVKADFDVRMSRENGRLLEYAGFIACQSANHGLPPFHRDAVARIIEHAARDVDDQDKLSTRLSEIQDLMYESTYWSKEHGNEVIRKEDVQRALEERKSRSNLTEERLQELITQGVILVDITEEVIGQVNGLAVYDLGDYRFGKPSRITAQTYMGEEGVINIERESKMSGRTHDKGILILSGYMGGQYGRGRPMSLSASLCFEQSYEGVDGDSASSTELYALLSSLSGLPIRQGIAVTGSVNQHGVIQPIGGVNEKIEGFFRVCEERGLTGDQGVMIPQQNASNLMLDDDVIEAVRAGKFHIYSVSHVDEGIEILTGTPAGAPDEEGMFTEGSVHDRVDQRLHELAEGLREFGRPVGPADGEEDEEGHEKDPGPPSPPGPAEGAIPPEPLLPDGEIDPEVLEEDEPEE